MGHFEKMLNDKVQCFIREHYIEPNRQLATGEHCPGFKNSNQWRSISETKSSLHICTSFSKIKHYKIKHYLFKSCLQEYTLIKTEVSATSNQNTNKYWPTLIETDLTLDIKHHQNDIIHIARALELHKHDLCALT